MAKDGRWTESETEQVATDLVGIARRFQERLNDRDITVEFLDGLVDKVGAAKAAAAGQPVRMGEQKGATETVAQLLVRAAERTAAIRGAIQRKLPTRKDVHKVYGVGGPDPRGSVKSSLAAIDAVLAGAAAYPSETRAAKILERDLEGLRTLRASILAADAAQEGAKGRKKGGTSSKDQLFRDVVSGVDDILAAAELEFVDEPEILSAFTSPIPSKKKKRAQPPPG